MLNKSVFLFCLSLSLFISASAFAQESCTNDDQDTRDNCVSSAIQGCRDATPGCAKHSVTLGGVRTRVLNNCCSKKSNRRKKRCIHRHLTLARTSQIVYGRNEFAAEVIKMIRSLTKDDCP